MEHIATNENSSLLNDLDHIDWEEFDAITYLDFEGLLISDDWDHNIPPDIFSIDYEEFFPKP